MFSYAKNDIQKRIKNCEKSLDNERKKEQSIRDNIENIGECLFLKNKIRKSTFWTLLSLGFTFTFLVPIFIDLGALAAIIGAYSISVINLGIFGYSSSQLFKNRRKLKKDCANFLRCSDEKLAQQQSILAEEEFQTRHEILSLRNKIRNLDCELEKLGRFERILEEIENMLENPYYVADDKEEYQELLADLIKKNQRFLSIMTGNGTDNLEKSSHSGQTEEQYHAFLSYPNVNNQEFEFPITNDSIDYSKVHFDNCLTEPVSYLQKPKQKSKNHRPF